MPGLWPHGTLLRRSKSTGKKGGLCGDFCELCVVYLCKYICIYTCEAIRYMCICVLYYVYYMYVYIYIYIYIYICIYICIVMSISVPYIHYKYMYTYLSASKVDFCQRIVTIPWSHVACLALMTWSSQYSTYPLVI
jgi:hypothetical protein